MPLTKITLLNVRHKTNKSTEKKCFDMGLENDFLDMKPKDKQQNKKVGLH